MAKQTATADRQRRIDEAFERGDDAHLPAEIRSELRELVEREPTTISVLAAGDVAKAYEAARALQESSIRLTNPEDWVIFKAKDGAELAYLQDTGCQRVRSLWGITFDRINLREDVVEAKLDGGDIYVEVQVSGRCTITGEENSEIGARGSDGFFASAWESSKDKPVERERVRANIRKAAIANGQGRLVRRLTGLGQVPKARLLAIGLDEKRLRGTDFQSGTKGGSGDYASDPQLKKLVGDALMGGKVRDLESVGDFNALFAKLKRAAIPKQKASQIIERLVKAGKGEITVAQFEDLVGTPLAGPPPADGEGA